MKNDYPIKGLGIAPTSSHSPDKCRTFVGGTTPRAKTCYGPTHKPRGILRIGSSTKRVEQNCYC